MKFCIIALSIVVLTSCKPIGDYLYEGKLHKYIDEESGIAIERVDGGHFHLNKLLPYGSAAIYDIYHDKIHNIIYWRITSDRSMSENKCPIYIYNPDSPKTYILYDNDKYIKTMVDVFDETPDKEILPAKHIQDTINNKIKFIPIKDFWNELEPKTKIDYRYGFDNNPL